MTAETETGHPDLNSWWNMMMMMMMMSPYVKENTTLHHYRDQLVNAVQGNNHWLCWESYKNP
jgi:hypothetical protein